MEPDREFANADPDYETYNIALKKIEKKEDEENELTSEKLYNIIAEEFDKELTIRQKHLEELEDKILKAQKLLHLVRYALISSYYNKESLEHAGNNEDPSTLNLFDAQNRIHPAIKKLLGNNSSLEVLTARGKRKIHNKYSDNNESLIGNHPVNIKKIKLNEPVNDSIKCENVDVSQSMLKRKKTKHRILVGNISKWMPSLENDNTTHKWMVYVRGIKEGPDLSHIIEKVIFYLHPSYKPHDVVEVSEYPFHLSRRGWGEFPLRVQIFFKCSLNKPVSIVHNLKLDKTYTGRQTLGNETVVDLYLHDNDILIKSEPKISLDNSEIFTVNINKDNVYRDNHQCMDTENSFKKEYLKQSEDSYNIKNDTFTEVKEEFTTPGSSSFEHNYCHDEEINVKVEFEDQDTPPLDTSLLDHNYSLPYSDLSELTQDVTAKKVYSDNDMDQGGNLIFGLDDSYVTEKEKVARSSTKEKYIVRTFTTATGHPIKILPQSFNKVLLSNGNIVQIKLLNTPQIMKDNLETTTNIKKDDIDTEIYKVNFPRKLFKSMGEVLPYLFKRLPLWSTVANSPGFKMVYPFMAGSMEEFFSWSLGKQLSAEWSRAKAIKKILQSEQFPNFEEWNTKTFFMYGRSHGYSPLQLDGDIFKKPSTELELLKTCFIGSHEKLPQNYFVNYDVNVNVVDNMLSPTLEKSKAVDISDSTLRHHCSFVKETALDCGIVLKTEEIIEGATWNGAERMILEAVKCLAENLVRRANHHLTCRQNSTETSEIGVQDVKTAISERPQIKFISDYQKERLRNDFFS